MESGSKWGIRIQEIPVGRDLLVIVTGGEAHIGSVATAYLSEGSSRETVVQTADVPGHREHELASEMASKAAGMLGVTVTVAAGIHFDDLARSEIQEIVTEAHSAFNQFLADKATALRENFFVNFETTSKKLRK